MMCVCSLNIVSDSYQWRWWIDAVVDGLKYQKSHEYVKMEGDVATVGISDFAQVGLLYSLGGGDWFFCGIDG